MAVKNAMAREAFRMGIYEISGQIFDKGKKQRPCRHIYDSQGHVVCVSHDIAFYGAYVEYLKVCCFALLL